MKRVNFTSFILHQNLVLGLVILLSIFASMQSYRAPKQAVDPGGPLYNHYNNYTIYKQSFFHLIQGDDLYVKYPDEHWDLYKYTPSFSVLFGSLAFLPDWLGLIIWNLINSLVLFAAIYYLPRLQEKQKALIILIVIVELLTAVQNEQSNALIAGLLIMAYGLLERNKYFIATALLVFSVFIKLFGVVGFVLFLLYPEKLKFIKYTAFWSVIFLALPLIFVGFDVYIKLYESFFNMLQNDHQASYGLSVMGWLHSWFGFTINKDLVVLTGASIFMIPFIFIKAYHENIFRSLALVSVLIWVVIFNHKAESPTFIIAMAGIGIWFAESRKTRWHIAILFFSILFTSLSVGDIFPRSFRDQVLVPYVVKVVPSIIVWALVLVSMIKIGLTKTYKTTIN